MKKLSFDDIVRYISVQQDSKSMLLTTEKEFYEEKEKNKLKPSEVLLRFKCDCGEEYLTIYSRYKKGKRRCDSCSGKCMNYRDITKFIGSVSNSGCQLVTSEKEYDVLRVATKCTPSYIPLEIKCSCGVVYICNFADYKFNNHRTCKNCKIRKLSESHKLTMDQVQEIIESKSQCKLMTNDFKYINSRTKNLLLQCKCGESFVTSLDNFHKCKKSCDKCSNNSRLHLRRIGYKNIKKFIEVESSSGCILISTHEEFKNITDDIFIKCKCGEPYKTTFERFKVKNKKQCDSCSLYKLAVGKKVNYEEYMDKLKELNPPVWHSVEISNYEEASSFVDCICKKCGHQWSTIAGSLYRHGCRECFKINNRGMKHPNWKGGVTDIASYLRENIKEWKRESAKACNYRCILTGRKFDVIHHLYGFNLILEELFENLSLAKREHRCQYTFSELSKIVNECKKLHNKYPLGICLTKDVHTLFHSLYGKCDNTPEQFEDFKQRYLLGDFKEIIHNAS